MSQSKSRFVLKTGVRAGDDSSSEQQLRMQMIMDRYAKAMETASNAEKKMGDASSGILKNLK